MPQSCPRGPFLGRQMPSYLYLLVGSQTSFNHKNFPGYKQEQLSTKSADEGYKLTPSLYPDVHSRLARVRNRIPTELDIRILVDKIPQRVPQRVVFLFNLKRCRMTIRAGQLSIRPKKHKVSQHSFILLLHSPLH